VGNFVPGYEIFYSTYDDKILAYIPKALKKLYALKKRKIIIPLKALNIT
jgi:hypothetical protein